MPIHRISEEYDAHRARFWNQQGRRIQRDFPSFAAAEAAVAAEAGPSSLEDLRALTLGGAAAFHLVRMHERGCITSTIKNVELLLRPLVNRHGHMELRSVGSADLLALHTELAEVRAPSGMGGIRNAWSLFWDVSVDRGIAARNEARIAFAAFGRHATTGARKRPPTDMDMAAIEAACGGPTSRLAVRLASRAGASEAELVVLAWDDVDLDRGRVTFRFYMSGGITLQQSRPDRLRTVPLDPTTLELLRAWYADPQRPDTPFVLCTPEGGRLQTSVLSYVIKRVQFGIEMAGVRRRAAGPARPRRNRRYAMDLFQARYSMGDLAAYAVVQWYRQGRGEKEILALAGHASIRALRSYRAAFAEVDMESAAIEDIDDLLREDEEQRP